MRGFEPLELLYTSASDTSPRSGIISDVQLGPRARTRTGSCVTVFETAALPFRYTGLVGTGRLELPIGFTLPVSKTGALPFCYAPKNGAVGGIRTLIISSI